jgi:uncharacterized protein YdeI (YjbR/CyaY-like superfamily)
MAGAGKEFPEIAPRSLEALRAWLSKHHTQKESVWVVDLKKAAGGAFTAGDITDACLCYGWIDSLPRKRDASRAMLLISPRRAGSGWSKVNKEKIARLTLAGLLAPPGLAAIALAKADGSWTKLDGVDALMEPVDLAQKLNESKAARSNWDGFPPSARRGILEWILNAKRPDTRAKRIEQTVALAKENKRANQWPR